MRFGDIKRRVVTWCFGERNAAGGTGDGGI